MRHSPSKHSQWLNRRLCEMIRDVMARSHCCAQHMVSMINDATTVLDAEATLCDLAPTGSYARVITHDLKSLSEATGRTYLSLLEEAAALLKEGSDPREVMMYYTAALDSAHHGGRFGNVGRCVCCGEPVPEGRQVCWKCEHKEDDS